MKHFTTLFMQFGKLPLKALLARTDFAKIILIAGILFVSFAAAAQKTTLDASKAGSRPGFPNANSIKNKVYIRFRIKLGGGFDKNKTYYNLGVQCIRPYYEAGSSTPKYIEAATGWFSVDKGVIKFNGVGAPTDTVPAQQDYLSCSQNDAPDTYDFICDGKLYDGALNVVGSTTASNYKVVFRSIQPAPPTLPDMTLYIDVTVNLDPKKDCGCDQSGTCAAGGAGGQLHSIDWKAVVGRGNYGDANNYLSFNSDLPASSLSLPTSLFASTSSDAELIRDGTIAPRQLLTHEALASIDVTNNYKYDIHFYLASQAGTKSNGVYVPTAAPYKTITIENPDGSTNNNRLFITELQGGVTNLTTYVYDTNTVPNQWTMLNYNGLQKETLTRNWDTNQTIRTEVKTIYTPGTPDVPVNKEQKQFTVFPWGEEETQQIIDPDGAQLTTTWTYYTNSADVGKYAKLKQKNDPNGYWEKYDYDTSFRLTKVVSPFLNSLPTDADNLCRVVTTTYTNTLPQETIVETLLGQEVSRKYHVYYDDVVQEIQCLTPGASYTATDNLITITTNYPTGDPFAGQIKSLSNPDGTMSLYSYSVSSSQKTTTVYSGQPNVTKTAILEGTKQVAVVDLAGKMISSATYNVTGGADGTLLDSQTYSYPSGDDLKLSPRITYLDGTQTQVNSDCCVVNNTVAKDGTTTVYLYDGRKRRLGTTQYDLNISTTNLLDGAGNILQTVRVGSDGSIITNYQGSYDLAGRLVKETNALNGVTTYTNVFNTQGQLIKTTTYADLSTRIETYALDGSLLSISGTAVHPVNYLYGVDANGAYVTEVRLNDLGGTNEWTKTYKDTAGRAYKIVYASASGTPASISYYNNKGQLTNTVDPDGVSMLYAYNLKGEQTYTVLDTNRNASIDYNGNDRISFVTNDVVNSHGFDVRRSRTYVWNTSADASNLVSMAETSVDGLKSWSTIYNNGTSIASSNVTVYDALNHYRYETNVAPDGSYTLQTYHNGQLTSVLRKAGATQIGLITYSYDPHGRQFITTDAGSGSVTNYYNDADQVNGTAMPLSQVTSNFFDVMNRLIVTKQADNTYVSNVYTLKGELQFTYGSRTYPVQYSYDAQGRMQTMTTWKNAASGTGAAITTWNYDPYRGFLTNKVYDGSNAGPRYDYTDAGRLKTRYWARGTNTTYTYNNVGEIASIAYNDGTPGITNGYDRLGRLNVISNSPSVCNLTYNDVGELLSEAYTQGPLTGLTITNVYDSFLRRSNLAILNPLSSILASTTYGYDSASRLQTVSDGTNSATYTYLANSPLVSQIDFANNGTPRMTTTKRYDALNRLTNITSIANSTVVASYSYGMNNANQRTTVTNADNTRWVYQYDNLGQVTSGKKYWSDGTVVAGQQFQYAFDDIGNRTSADAGGNENGTSLRHYDYGANNLNQYTNRSVANAVDVLGSAVSNATVTVNNQRAYRKNDYFRQELTVTNNANPVWLDITNIAVLNHGTNADTVATVTGNTFLPQTPENFFYDADGNLTSDGRWTNHWDAENRLISMESLTNGPAGSKLKLIFGYDCFGRRISKTVSNWTGSAWTLVSDQRFVYDGWNLIAALTPALSLQTSFLWGRDLSGSRQGAGGVGGLLAISSSGSAQFTCYDGNGNVTTLIDANSSTITGQYEYGPFGKTLRVTGTATSSNPFRYSTKYNDVETDLIYYGFRFYNADIGAWVGREPLGEQGSRNLYAFVHNASVNTVDILGLADLPAIKQDILNNKISGIEDTLPISAQLLKHYLDATGTDVHLDDQWILSLSSTSQGADKNLDRIKKWIKSEAPKTPDGQSVTIYNYWDAVTHASTARADERDAMYSLGGYTVTTYVKANLTRQGKCIKISGAIEHLVWDYYDFNADTYVPIPGQGKIYENDLIAMANQKLAKPFWDYAWMNQTFTGRDDLGTFWDSMSIVYGERTPGWGGNNVYIEVVAQNPSAARMITPPPPRASGGYFKF